MLSGINKGFKRGLFREIFTYTSFIAINIVVDQINWNIDKLLLARYKGTVAVAVYSVGYTLNNYYSIPAFFVYRGARVNLHKNRTPGLVFCPKMSKWYLRWMILVL